MYRIVPGSMTLAVIAAVLLTRAAALASDGRAHTITIAGASLEPRTVQVALHERVAFVNRSGRAVHVEFRGPSGEHHVFQVPGSIWAEFHWPGQHPYVVHFAGNIASDLQGVVAVDYGPPPVPGPECGGFTIEEICIER